MKKISVVVPCYNEEKSVRELYQRINDVFENELRNYCYEIIFVDDFSQDNTRENIRELCLNAKNVKAVFNAKNFGFHRNVFESFRYATGDCVFLIFGDLQDPPEMLPEFIEKWESGSKCVVGQRYRTDEGKLMTLCRKCYYQLINSLGDKKQIQFMNGFGLYDKLFVDAISNIEEVAPYFKTIIAEYAMDLEIVQYSQSVSKRGKSNFNFWKNYDFAMHGLTSSTKMLMRISTFLGLLVGLICMAFAVFVFIRKLIFWDSYPLGTASVTIGVFFIGAIQLFFIGVLGEYILSINEKVERKPRVIIDEKINFEE